MIEFFVPGEPIPQGSLKAFMVNGQARVVPDNKRTEPWRKSVARAAAGLFQLSEGPAAVELEFVMPRTKSMPKSFTRAHTVRPDVDKLERAILDALTGVVWKDDSQVVSLRAGKRYARVGEEPGARICVTPWHEEGPPVQAGLFD